MTDTTVKQNYIDTHSKSQAVGFILTLLLGPLGLLYSSVVGSIILIVIAIVTASTVIGPAICWVLAIAYSFITVSDYNAKVRAAAELGVRE